MSESHGSQDTDYGHRVWVNGQWREAAAGNAILAARRQAATTTSAALRSAAAAWSDVQALADRAATGGR